MAEPTSEFPVCAVCARSILRGERVSAYIDADGDEQQVCPLCKPRAEAAGWIPAALADTVARPEPARRGPAFRIRERLAKVPAAVAATRGASAGTKEAAADGDGADEARPRRASNARPAERKRQPNALEVFNSSPEARKVAGLRRSLGEPRVSIRDGSEGNRIITVAWDLSWYQWDVRGESLRQVGKGNEISELPIADRAWNATAAEDGTLRLA